MVEARFVRKRKGIRRDGRQNMQGRVKDSRAEQVNCTHYGDVLGVAVLFVAELFSSSMGSVCLVIPLPKPTPSVMSIRFFFKEKAILLQVGM